MASEVDIGGSGSLFVGEDKIIDLEVLDTSNVPVNIAGWTIKMFVRVNNSSANPAVFEKTATITGSYSAVRATNTQRARVTLSDTEMNTVTKRTYKHAWKRMDDGSETVIAYGSFEVQKSAAT
jgi:P pilus assembly chaperone PapD